MKTIFSGVATVVAVLSLAGCADLSGVVDDAGRNGYDKVTCADFKSLAMDVQYAAVSETQGKARVRELVEESAKASDEMIRRGIQDYAAAYTSRNKDRQAAAVSSLMRVCRF